MPASAPQGYAAPVTWLQGLPDGDTGWDRVTATQPGLIGALTGLQRRTWDLVDPVVLELCRIRMATLLGATADAALRSTQAAAAGLSEAQVAALPSWPSSPLFSEAQRAALALAEQFLIDCQGVTDAQVQAVTEHLGASQCFVLVNALWSMEAMQRTCLVLGIEPTLETIGS